jgi:serpin B
LKLTQTHYGAGLKEVDFARATEDARKTINAWVEKETQDKIKDLLKEGVLSTDTRLVLTNAIYFKGDWAWQFKKDRTSDQPFHVTADKTVQAPLMNQKGKFNLFETDNFQMLELPYAGKDLSMVVLLPKKVDGLPALEKALTAAKFAEYVKNLREVDEVTVLLPKFKTTAEFQLNDELSKLGMKQAFSNQADFSGIDGEKDLYLSAVIHKAFVDVNEEGTEAAAATAVVAEPKEAKITPVFRADRPFLFVIRDKRNDAILFLGRLSNPQ